MISESHLISQLDHDECSSNNGGCDQVCVNEHATYRCECYAGYRLGTDGKSCAGKHPSEILWNSASCFSLLSSFWMTFVTYTVKNLNVKQIHF